LPSELPPGRRYEEIADTDRKTITINAKVSIDATHYAHDIGLSFSKFVEAALIEKIHKVQEELHEPKLTAEEYNKRQDRSIKRMIEEMSYIQSGVFDRENLDKATEKFQEKNK
jgi:hypothetical protein